MKTCNHYIIKNNRYVPTIKYLPEDVDNTQIKNTITDIKYPVNVCYCTQCGYILHDADFNRLNNLIRLKNKFKDKCIETPLDRALIDNSDITKMVSPVPGEYFTNMDKENLNKSMNSAEPKYPSFYDPRNHDKRYKVIKLPNSEYGKVMDKRITNRMNEMGNGNRKIIDDYLRQDDSTLKYNDGCPCHNCTNCTCCRFKD